MNHNTNKGKKITQPLRAPQQHTGKNCGSIEMMRQHERATWNAWVHHEIHCNACQVNNGNPATPRSVCLTGAACFEEWTIARDRHMTALADNW